MIRVLLLLVLGVAVAFGLIYGIGVVISEHAA